MWCPRRIPRSYEGRWRVARMIQCSMTFHAIRTISLGTRLGHTRLWRAISFRACNLEHNRSSSFRSGMALGPFFLWNRNVLSFKMDVPQQIDATQPFRSVSSVFRKSRITFCVFGPNSPHANASGLIHECIGGTTRIIQGGGNRCFTAMLNIYQRQLVQSRYG